MDGRYVHRIGYAWLELRHDEPRHAPQFVSFGVCLDAHKEWDEVKPRFFYVPEARVGIDFQLIGRDERPPPASSCATGSPSSAARRSCRRTTTRSGSTRSSSATRA